MNNISAIGVTLVINLVTGFLFSRVVDITLINILWESLICVFVTTFINIWIVNGNFKKIRVTNTIPVQVPVSKLMQRLPKNPVALGAVFILAFGVLTVGLNALVLRFFGISAMTLVSWMAYKLLYTTILSAKILEYAIFRYLQPDCTEAAASVQIQTESDSTPVRNPLPKINMFKEIYVSVTGNIAMNIIFGTALGGAVIDAAGNVIIYPTTVQGIPITGLILGLIIGILVTNGVVNGVTMAILAIPDGGGEPPPPDKCFTWMPKRKIPLICLVSVCVMAFSAVALWALMKLFGLSIMNFYQFTIFITLYASLLSKPLSGLLIRRCTQPDYIRYVMEKEALSKKESLQ